MKLDLDGKALAEHVTPFVEQAASVGPVTAANERGDRPGRWPGERDEPSAQLGDFPPRDVRPAASLLAVFLGPARPCPHAPARDERGEVAVAFGRPHEERGGPPIDSELGPDYRPEVAARARRVDEARDATQVCRVGDAECRVA